MAHGGGNNAGMVVHWPKGIKAKGEIRRQYASVIDIVPTILEAVGVPEPKVVNGIEQTPIAGVSMKYSFDDANAKERHTTQYNEAAGNRSIYHDGWLAAVVHNVTWEPKNRAADVRQGQVGTLQHARGLRPRQRPGREDPEKLEEMKALFTQEAIKNNVFPMDDRRFERLNAEVSGRPDIMAGPQGADALSGHAGDDREQLHRHEEPLAHDHRRSGDSRRAAPRA